MVYDYEDGDGGYHFLDSSNHFMMLKAFQMYRLGADLRGLISNDHKFQPDLSRFAWLKIQLSCLSSAH